MPTADKIEWPQGNPLFEVQFRAFTESLAGNGIRFNSDLLVTKSGNFEIEVSSGEVLYNGNSYSLSNSENIPISPGDSQDRWDTVAFDTKENESGSETAVVKEGTAGSAPEPPDLVGDEILLAVIYVPANSSSLISSNILNWRTKTSSDTIAGDILYDDSTGEYGVSNIQDALDELATAVQISQYPLSLGSDTDNDVNGSNLTDSGTTIWDSGSSVIPKSVLGGPASSLNSYPLGLANETDLDLDNEDLEDGSTTVWDASVSEIPKSVLGGPASSLTSYPLGLASETDLDLDNTDLEDGSTTVWDASESEVPREQQNQNKTAQTTSSNYTTQGEELILTGSAGTGGIEIIIAGADRQEGATLIVVDSTGGAETDPVTVSTEGNATINGQNEYVLDEEYESISLVSDGSNWVILPDHFKYLNQSGGTMSGAIDMAGQALQNGEIENATLITDIDSDNNNINNAKSIEAGPLNDNYEQCIKVVRNNSTVGYIDNSGSDMRMKGAPGSDLFLIDDSDNGIRVVSGSGGNVEIDGQAVADALQANSATDLDLINEGGNGIHILDSQEGDFTIDGKMSAKVPTDTFQILMELERNGTRVGFIDNSGSDFRFKADNGGDAEIINESSEGMAIRDGTANADFDGSLEINSGEALVNDLGDSQVRVDELSNVSSGGGTATLVGGVDARGMLAIYADDNTNGLFFLAGNSSTTIQVDGFTDTSGSSGSSNVYHDGTNFVVENQTAAEIEYDTVFVGAPQ